MSSAPGRVRVLARHVQFGAVAEGGRQKVCVVVGAGAGIGVNVAKRFANEGYATCLCRRSDKDGLDRAVQEIRSTGGQAQGYLLDAIRPGAIEEMLDEIERTVGDVDVVVYNLGAQVGNRALDKTSLKTFETGWRLGCEGLFRLAKAATPAMVARGTGTILVTSATAAARGNSGQHSHAAAMGGRRMLCQTLNAELSSKGIHVCHVIIDGAVDAPDTLGKMLGKEKFAALRETRGKGDGLIQPKHVADLYWTLARQHRSSWTFECDVRSHTDTAWWNHPLDLM